MLAGYIMSGDTAVAKFTGRIVTSILPERTPLCFRHGGDLELWLESRAIDRHRTNSRILKRILRLGDTSDLNTVLRVHGATITDNYWVKTEDEPDLRWEDICFFQDYFADVALNGSFDSFSRQYTPEQLRTPSPELTNTGSFEKCWRLMDRNWTMFKRGSDKEVFSEVFIAALGKKLGFRMADYKAGDGCSITVDFTESKYNFEPMWNLIGDNEVPEDIFVCLRKLSPGLEREYLDILFMDALVYNVDRHTQNFGVLRERETGKIISMAPNFDNNMALISRGYAEDINKIANPMVQEFRELLQNHMPEFVLPVVTRELVMSVAHQVMPEVAIDREYVADFVVENYKQIKKVSE